MDADEQQICTYLASCPGQLVSGLEIARNAGGKWRYLEDPNWAVQPLLRLVERAAVDTDTNNRYRLQPTAPTNTLQDPAVNVSHPVTPHWSVSKKTASPAPRSKKILYVDDDKDLRELVAIALHDDGYQVLTAADATEAMLLTEGVQLGLIILDLDLAGEDGLMLLRFLKPNQVDVPIILYTGLEHDNHTIQEMLRLGARQYVRKGPLDSLRKAVEETMR
jgi:CheY-like chemotaxis protein